MKIVILIPSIATFAGWAAIKLISARFKDPDIQGRFIERLSYIPSRVPASALLTHDASESWLTDTVKTAVRQTYAFPVLFPLDYFFLISLGPLPRVGLGRRLGSPLISPLPVWIWWIFPTLYIVCDLLEDSTLVSLFSKKLGLNDAVYYMLRSLTRAQLATVLVAIGQTGFLLALWGLLRLYPPYTLRLFRSLIRFR